MKSANTITQQEIIDYQILAEDAQISTSGLFDVTVGSIEAGVIFNTAEGYIAQIWNESKGEYVAEDFSDEFSKDEVVEQVLECFAQFQPETNKKQAEAMSSRIASHAAHVMAKRATRVSPEEYQAVAGQLPKGISMKAYSAIVLRDSNLQNFRLRFLGEFKNLQAAA